MKNHLGNWRDQGTGTLGARDRSADLEKLHEDAMRKREMAMPRMVISSKVHDDMVDCIGALEPGSFLLVDEMPEMQYVGIDGLMDIRLKRPPRRKLRTSPRTRRRDRRLARSRSMRMVAKFTFHQRTFTDRGMKMLAWKDAFGIERRIIWKP